MTIDAKPTQMWGQLRDPDIAEGLSKYAKHDFDLLTPNTVRNLPEHELANIAQQCGNLLIELYGRDEEGTARYPLSIKDAEALTDRIRQGTTHLFALMLNGTELRSMAAVVEQDNPFGADITFAELGRAAESPKNNVSSRALLKNRVEWVFGQDMGIDFLTSTTRSAEQWANDMPGGKGVQSVWWGSRRFGSEIPFVTTHTNYDYRIGRPEPFTSFVIPTNPQKWAESVSQHTIYVDTAGSKEMIDTLIEEGTVGTVSPNIVVAETSGDVDTEGLSITALQEPSSKAGAIYSITDKGRGHNSINLAKVDTELDSTISQKLVVESDIATTTRGGQTLRTLIDQGWTLVGWQPSQLVYGTLCPVVARLNPNVVDQAVKPMYYPRYFDEAGMPETRRLLTRAYDIINDKARR